MPRATWEALRNHIITERKRKQEEEEKSEEYERYHIHLEGKVSLIQYLIRCILVPVR
jgi:hypothetical protein